MASTDHVIASHSMTSDVSCAMTACIEVCSACAEVRISCADACLGERQPEPLIIRTRLSLDRANVGGATGRAIVRQTATKTGGWAPAAPGVRPGVPEAWHGAPPHRRWGPSDM